MRSLSGFKFFDWLCFEMLRILPSFKFLDRPFSFSSSYHSIARSEASMVSSSSIGFALNGLHSRRF